MKLSERISNLHESATLAVAERAAAMKAAGADLVSLTTGEPDFDTPQHIKDAALEALRKGMTKYTAASGIAPLKDAVIRKLARDNGLTYDRASVLISCGGKHSIYNVFQAVLNEGDEVLIPAPYWTSYPDMVKAAGATPVIIPTSAVGGYRITVDDLRRHLSPRSRMLVLNSPANPTGAVYSRDELTALASAAAEADILILSDEIYEKLTYDEARHVSIASLSPDAFRRTIVVNGVSKAYAMTGWRIGYAAGPREIIEVASRLQSQSTSCPPSITQHAAVAALDGPQESVTAMTAAFRRRRGLALDLMGKIRGVRCNPPGGAFYLFPDVSALYDDSIRGSMDFANRLLDPGGVAVVPGAAFGDDRCIRISYATSDENLAEGIRRIARCVEGLRR